MLTVPSQNRRSTFVTTRDLSFRPARDRWLRNSQTPRFAMSPMRCSHLSGKALGLTSDLYLSCSHQIGVKETVRRWYVPPRYYASVQCSTHLVM
jgi:hypothetical protein